MPAEDRLVLGTAQLGMEYGVANRAGLPDRDTAMAILEEAWQTGVRTFDTAVAYGKSEDVLGAWLRDTGHEARILTKLPGDIDATSRNAVMRAATESGERLGRPPTALLLHRSETLRNWNDGVRDALFAVRDAGLCELLGVSVYDAADAQHATELGLDVVQVPYNVFDRRVASLSRGIWDSCEVHLRSVFLQGLLLLAPCAAPIEAKPSLRRWTALCRELERPPVEVALLFALQTFPEARVVVGAETVEQVRENAGFAEGALESEAIEAILALPPVAPAVTDPRRWH